MVANTLQNWAIRDAATARTSCSCTSSSPRRGPRRGRPGRRPAHRAHRARRHRQRPRHRRVQRTGTSRPSTARSATCSQNIANLPVRRAGRAPSRTTAGRVSLTTPRRRSTLPGDLRHRLDQARPGRPDRPHQGRRQRDRRLPARRPPELRRCRRPRRTPSSTSSSARACRYTTWEGWYRLDAHERALGEPEGRERVKVVEREDMLRASEPHKA